MEENIFESVDMQEITKASFPDLVGEFISLVGKDMLGVIKQVFSADGIQYNEGR